MNGWYKLKVNDGPPTYWFFNECFLHQTASPSCKLQAINKLLHCLENVL